MAYNMDRWRELLPDGWRPSWLPQMPFTDYHQLNLDWIIETVKEWTERLIAFFDEDGAKELVEDVLEEHPEWTTTVMDGAITKAKINTAFLPEIENAYVTPEQYGAVGDGGSDDTNAVNDAIQSGLPVFLKGTYKITSTININRDCSLFGDGAIYMPSSDTITSMFAIQTPENVEVENVKFYSIRDNATVHAPEGHSRATGSLSSNIIAFNVYAVGSLSLRNCTCDSLEYDIKTTTPASGVSGSQTIKLINHTSTNYSMCAYISNVNKFEVCGGIFKCYPLLGTGDHTFYGAQNNINIVIYDCVIDSFPATGTTYDLHFNSSATSTGVNVYIHGAILHSNSFVACNYTGDVIIDGCKFYPLQDVTSNVKYNPLSLPDAGKFDREKPFIFKNCYFAPKKNLQRQIPLKSPVIFESCYFDGWIFNTAIETVDNTDNNIFVFNNCTLKANDDETTSMFYTGVQTPFNYKITINNSNLYQKLADGFASLRGSGTQTIEFYNSHLKRDAAKPYLEYAATYNGIYKFYNCCSEYGKIRGTGDNATFVNVNNGFAE